MNIPNKHPLDLCVSRVVTGLAAMLWVGVSGLGCDGQLTIDPPAQRVGPLEEAAAQHRGDAGDRGDTGDVHAAPADPKAPPAFDELDFDDQVDRLMAESEAFRNAVASIRVVDGIPEGFVRAPVVMPATHMTCNEPPSPVEVELANARARAPLAEVNGDPEREIDLFTRLHNLKPGDLAPESHDPADEQP